jgi:hypothetical protein
MVETWWKEVFGMGKETHFAIRESQAKKKNQDERLHSSTEFLSWGTFSIRTLFLIKPFGLRKYLTYSPPIVHKKAAELFLQPGYWLLVYANFSTPDSGVMHYPGQFLFVESEAPV